MCYINNGAGGLISKAWCIQHFASTIFDLPADLSEEEIARPELLIHEETAGKKRIQIYYTPFDLPNPYAKILLVGITPGRQQLYRASMEARRALHEDASPDDAVHRAKEAASFAGAMRKNAVSMLDAIGLADVLGLASAELLFHKGCTIAAATSAICHSVLVNGANYTGHGLGSLPIIDCFITQVLGTELEMTSDALVIPFGKSASLAVERCIEVGRVDRSRCLLGFPHPSGANGHRLRQFERERDRLSRTLGAWAKNSIC